MQPLYDKRFRKKTLALRRRISGQPTRCTQFKKNYCIGLKRFTMAKIQRQMQFYIYFFNDSIKKILKKIRSNIQGVRLKITKLTSTFSFQYNPKLIIIENTYIIIRSIKIKAT